MFWKGKEKKLRKREGISVEGFYGSHVYPFISGQIEPILTGEWMEPLGTTSQSLYQLSCQ